MAPEKINILIVEDEGITALALENALTKKGYAVVGTPDKGWEALNIIKKNPIDLVLLDIHIKGRLTGIETARELTKIKNIPFIFLTAFSDDETVNEARNTNPSAYLVKPFQDRRLLITIELALHNFAQSQSTSEQEPALSVDELSSTADLSNEILIFNHYIFIKQGGKFTKTNPEAILYFKADGNHTRVVLPQKKFMLRMVLTKLLKKIDNPRFIRIHRSYAVNISQITSFDAHAVFIGKTELPLSRHYKKELLSHFE